MTGIVAEGAMPWFVRNRNIVIVIVLLIKKQSQEIAKVC